jgi:hypothetical protein
MTRSKTKPPIRKPVFDEESTVSFASQVATQSGAAGGAGPAEEPANLKSAKEAGKDRFRLTLSLKPEVITRIEEEAARKGKSVDQIVEKLVVKHLGKH